MENYLKTLVQKDKDQDDLSPTIKKLLGSVKAPKGFNYKKELHSSLNKKYSR